MNADTSGTLALQSNGTTKFTIDSTGAYGQLQSGGAVTLSSTSTSLITSIPTWVKRVTLVCNGAAQNSTDYLLVRLNGVTTGYTSTALVSNSSAATASATTGMLIFTGIVTNLNFTGSMTLYNQTGNTWVQSHTGIGTPYSPNSGIYGGGVIALASALSSISITTFNGTATLSGSITVLYE